MHVFIYQDWVKSVSQFSYILRKRKRATGFVFFTDIDQITKLKQTSRCIGCEIRMAYHSYVYWKLTFCFRHLGPLKVTACIPIECSNVQIFLF